MISPSSDQKRSYWKSNLRVIIILLAIWLAASCLCGIVFVKQMNEFSIGNLPLGFWIANQGAMLVFVLLILIYAVVMDVVDRRYRQSVNRKGGSRDD